jgi:hypothetical protein
MSRGSVRAQRTRILIAGQYGYLAHFSSLTAAIKTTEQATALSGRRRTGNAGFLVTAKSGGTGKMTIAITC